MNMRKILTLLTALLIVPQDALCAADAPAKTPNIVFIYSDDQPPRAMGSSDPYFSTPHIDRLAEESVVFKNAFVTTSICAVSRASFFTGQHSVRHGIASFNTPLSSAQMKQSYAGLLRQAGYRTAFLGKYAIGQPSNAPRELCLPEDQFDLWYGFLQALSYSQDVDGQKRYVTRVMEEKAISFLRGNPKDQPFLLIMALPEPHGQTGPWNYRDPDFKLNPPSGPPQRPKTMTQAALDRLPKAILRNPEARGRADWYYEHDVGTESQGKPLPRCEGVRTERWKYIRYKGTQPLQEELFDLRNNSLEEHNLAKEAEHAATLAKMSARCDELRKALR